MKDAKDICKNKMQEWKRGKTFAGSPIRSTKKKWSPALLEVQMPHKQTEQVAFTNFFGHCVLTAFVACIKYLCSGKYAATKTEGLPYHPPPPELFAMCVQLFTLKWNYEGKKKGKLCYLNVALSLAAPILPRFYRFLHFINHFAMAQWTLNCRLPREERRR